MALLPMIKDGTLNDGTYIHLLPFCKSNCSKGKCAKYYERISQEASGVFCCPYGLSSYVFKSRTHNIVFSGLRIRGQYDKAKAKSINPDQNIYNPLLSEENILALVQETAIGLDEQENFQKKLDEINDLLHETRTLNGRVKTTIDSLWENSEDETSISREELLTTLKNAHVSSHMISNRFAYFDSILNPSLSTISPYSAVVFKKFDKMRKLLKGYLRKNVWISLNSPSQCNYRYQIYSTFEILLFIVLENAIKYSVDNRSVDVDFEENGNILNVQIKSLGPYCDENEILHLCEKGFRGTNAQAIQPKGHGFGLNFAKQICVDHNIDISFESIYSHKDHGVNYGTFNVKLHFEQ